ncbi:MAG: IS21-like element ISBj11 family helper ATPase IstB [Chloroflexi bacterium OHK40]
MANRQEELTRLLRGLQLRQMAARYGELALRAARESISHEAFLYELAVQETAYRQQRRRERLLRESRLPREKTFAQLNQSRFSPLLLQQLERLRSGSWVREAVTVIAVGRPGAGKSHTTAALGHVLVEQGYTVYWTSTAALVQQLLAAKRDLRLPQELTRLDRFECVVLDDIGYVQQSREEMEVLFTFLAERYERRSVMISTNLVFSEWERIFKDPMTTLAAIDRVVHHAVILDMMGLESYRAKEASAQQAAAAAA